jgi:hypothetical protein
MRSKIEMNVCFFFITRALNAIFINKLCEKDYLKVAWLIMESSDNESVSSGYVNNTSEQTNNSSPQDSSDISKTTIAILVLLTLMISIIGTWTTLSELRGVSTLRSHSTTQAGQVQFAIDSPGIVQQKATQMTANVMLELQK